MVLHEPIEVLRTTAIISLLLRLGFRVNPDVIVDHLHHIYIVLIIVPLGLTLPVNRLVAFRIQVPDLVRHAGLSLGRFSQFGLGYIVFGEL